MYTVSQVKAINPDGTVKVGCLTSACSGCKASLFCNTKDDNDYLVLNPSKVQIGVGDYVELYMPPAPTILSTALVFALPLALFPVGYLLCKAIWPYQNEIIHALGGLACMALAFGIAAIVSVKNKKRLMPSITKIVGKVEDSEMTAKD